MSSWTSIQPVNATQVDQKIADDNVLESSTYGALLSVKGTGAVKGDGATDDTTAINAVITANPGRRIAFPAGTYMVNATASTGAGSQPVGIKLNQPGTELILDPGAVLKAITNNATNYSIIQVTGADCMIEGGTIMGDVGTHTGSTGEWGHGVDVNAGADRFRARGVRATKCWGDGFMVIGRPVDIALECCHSEDNRRQGLSIVDAIRPKVLGGAYINTGLTAFTGPGAGIDLEPTPATANDVIDALIIGVLLSGNKGPGFLASPNGRTLSGNVMGCRSVNNGAGGTADGYNIGGATNTIKVSGCYAGGNSQDGFAISAVGVTVANPQAVGNSRYGFSIGGAGVTITELVSELNAKSGIYIDTPADGTHIFGGQCRANGQLTTATYVQVDNYGPNSTFIGHISDAGTMTNKPNYGFVNRSTASNARYLGCDAPGAFTSGAFTDQTAGTTAVRWPVMGAAKQTATPVAAVDAATTQALVNDLRTKLIALGFVS